MADSNTSPSVQLIERDFSQRIEQSSITAFATMGFFEKGPVNEPIRLATQDDLRTIFGKPNDLSAQFWFPVATMLDATNSVWVTRVEDSLKLCPGVTVGQAVGSISTSASNRILNTEDISAGGTAIISNPQRVELYPLTYGSISADDVVSVSTDISAADPNGGGFLDSAEVTDQLSVFAIGPGTDYHNVDFAIINYDDYKILENIQIEYSEAFTDAEKTALATSILAAASAGSGLTQSIANAVVNTTTLKVNDDVLTEFLQFEFGPRSSVETGDSNKVSEFAFYEYLNDSLVNSWIVSPDKDSRDSNGQNNFANNVINDISNNIRIFVGTTETTAKSTDILSVPKTSLAGGDALTTSLGDLDGEFQVQLDKNYGNKFGIQFNALVDLGFADSVKQRMDAICNIRRDSIAILNAASSTMINLTTGAKVSKPTTSVKAYVDGLGVNSSYSAMYANYFKVFDPFNEKDVWIPCTGHVANRMAFTFDNFDPWFAFAGFERGIIPSGVSEVAYNPSDEQQKVLYTSRINPIVDFPGEGVIIMGQKTLQSFASNTDRINVRNLVIKIGRDVTRFARFVLFAQNDELTRTQFRAQVNPYLQGILQRRGLVDYKVVCDESNNPPEKVFAHEFNAYLLIKPTPTAEFVKITIANVGGTLSFDDVLTKGVS